MKLKLDIISQEKHLFSEEVDQLTAPALEGEVTILPNHIPLFTRLGDGVVVIKKDGKFDEFAILGGFMDVGPQNQVTILADAAFNTAEVNEAKALEAKRQAEISLKQKQNEVEFRQAEASLRKAVLELKVARRRSSRPGLPGSSGN
jgi:F-type H+-transporting ATPase subunit epsilon